MKLDLHGCALGSCCDVLEDIIDYDSVIDWVQAMANDDAAYVPSDISIIIGDKRYYVRRSCHFVNEMPVLLEALRGLPDDLVELPSDYMTIDVDVSESELHIDLGYESYEGVQELLAIVLDES